MTPISVIKDLTLTFRGIIAYQKTFKNSCFWDKEKMAKFQYNHLKKILIESNIGVPYYKELFHKIGFNPLVDFNKISDLEYIPILTKQKARDVREFLDNPKYSKGAMKLRTSGSTGEPFEVSVSNNAWVVEQAVVWRHWAWGGYKFRDKLAMIRSYVPKPGEALYKKDFLRNFYMFSPFNLNDEQIATYLDLMCKDNILILRGYPSSILTLAEFVIRTGHQVPSLKLILTASESLSNNDRQIIELAFNTKVSNHYGLAELVVMMGDCENHCGLHNYDDYGYLELLETETANHKRIVGTHLHNLATPLIRYDTGDIAEVGELIKTCNHSFLTIGNIIGRKDQQILTPEGYSIPTVNFYTMFESFQQISRWQIIQNSINEVELIVKIKQGADFADEELLTEIYKRLPNSMNVSINREVLYSKK
jgi:phenylacetate-CoA ligase